MVLSSFAEIFKLHIDRHVKFLKKKMWDNARRLVFIKHSAHARHIICAAMHREKLEVQGYVKDNSIKQCKKKVINTYNRVPPIITRVNMLFFLFFFKKPIRRFTIFFLSHSNKTQNRYVCYGWSSLY